VRSDIIKKGLERTPHRALLYATGIPKSKIGSPFIGVASSFTDIIPGHISMNELERFIEKGIHSAGGYPFLFWNSRNMRWNINGTSGYEIFFTIKRINC